MVSPLTQAVGFRLLSRSRRFHETLKHLVAPAVQLAKTCLTLLLSDQYELRLIGDAHSEPLASGPYDNCFILSAQTGRVDQLLNQTGVPAHLFVRHNADRSSCSFHQEEC